MGSFSNIGTSPHHLPILAEIVEIRTIMGITFSFVCSYTQKLGLVFIYLLSSLYIVLPFPILRLVSRFLIRFLLILKAFIYSGDISLKTKKKKKKTLTNVFLFFFSSPLSISALSWYENIYKLVYTIFMNFVTQVFNFLYLVDETEHSWKKKQQKTFSLLIFDPCWFDEGGYPKADYRPTIFYNSNNESIILIKLLVSRSASFCRAFTPFKPISQRLKRPLAGRHTSHPENGIGIGKTPHPIFVTARS